MHWTRRLKQENSDLKKENSQLRTAMESMSDSVRESEPVVYQTVKNLGVSVPVPERRHSEDYRDVRTKVFVSWQNAADANWLIPHEYFVVGTSGRAYQREELADNEIDIIVADDEDKENSPSFSGGGEVQGTWDFVTKVFRDRTLEEIEDFTIRTVYDPHGFISQFAGLSVEEVVRGRLCMVGSELFDEAVEFEEIPGYWGIIFPNLDEIILDGKSFADRWAAARTGFDQAGVMKLAKEAVSVEYPSGSVYQEPVYHFQLTRLRSGQEALDISIVATKQEVVNVSFGDVTPKTMWIGSYMEYEGDDVFGGTSAEGGKVRFV